MESRIRFSVLTLFVLGKCIKYSLQKLPFSIDNVLLPFIRHIKKFLNVYQMLTIFIFQAPQFLAYLVTSAARTPCPSAQTPSRWSQTTRTWASPLPKTSWMKCAREYFRGMNKIPNMCTLSSNISSRVPLGLTDDEGCPEPINLIHFRWLGSCAC